MLFSRGLGRPGLEPIRRYGSFGKYVALLIISFLPFLIFFAGSIVSLVQLIRNRAWYLWGVVIAGQLIASGCVANQQLQPHIKPLVRTRDFWPFVSIIDVGAFFLAQAGFATLCRLAWSIIPTSLTTVSFSSVREAGKVLRDRRIGYLLLLPHGVTPVVALWWPAASSWTPFLQLPFCAYFATVAVEYRRLALEWGAKEGEDEDLDPEGSRPCGKLFDALWVIAGTLTLRSILGVIAVAIGINQSPHKYLPLAYSIFVDDIPLFVCFRMFWKAHPGLYLPRQLLSLVFNKDAKGSYATIAME
ncbi:hypothetical protein SLS57_001968 [Botryosphaeria dothidea]